MNLPCSGCDLMRAFFKLLLMLHFKHSHLLLMLLLELLSSLLLHIPHYLPFELINHLRLLLEIRDVSHVHTLFLSFFFTHLEVYQLEFLSLIASALSTFLL